MDFEDAEAALRGAVAGLRGWTFERFQKSGGQGEPARVQGVSGRPYLFQIDVTDRSGDYDPKDELLELEFTIREPVPRRLFQPSVNTVSFLCSGEVFTGEVVEVARTTARAQGAGAVVLGVVLAGVATALLYRCVR